METNVIYSGDNIETMRRYIPDSSVDLIYADPPFFSNKKYEILWGNGYELRSFEDRWKGGINNYVAWMKPRIRECHRVLKKTGSMYLHCDYHASAHLRVLMDRIFGEEDFQNEIIWNYRQYGQSSVRGKRFERTFDSILFYTKSRDYTFNPIYNVLKIPLINARKHGFVRDEKGWFKTAPTGLGIGGYSQKAIDKMNAKGLIHWTRGGKPRKKYYRKSNKEFILDKKMWGCVWTDIPDMMHVSKERLGYPTQKPLALLARIIKASSNPMDIVLDPFCGCGTTIAVAHKLGRRWIGIDVSPTACKLMAKRMRKLGVRKTKVIGLPRTVEELKALQPFEFQNWVFEKLHGRVNPRKIGDLGIDGWVELDVPTQVKQSENVGRNVVDNFETAIKRYGRKKGVIVAFSFTKGAYEEVARAKLLNKMNSLDIKLKTVKEILKET